MCDKNYDDMLRKPRILTKCWHTVCTVCLIELMKDKDSFECPADNEVIFIRYMNHIHQKKNFQ